MITKSLHQVGQNVRSRQKHYERNENPTIRNSNPNGDQLDKMLHIICFQFLPFFICFTAANLLVSFFSQLF